MIRLRKQDCDDDIPFEFGKVVHIYIYRDHKIFIGKKVLIVKFEEHRRAIEVTVTEQPFICLFSRLYCPGVLHLKDEQNKQFLIGKDNWIRPSIFY